MKNLLKVLLLLVLMVYLGFAVTVFNNPELRQKCVALDVVVADSSGGDFITADEVRAMLKKARLYPVGKRMADIDCQKIEREIAGNPFVDNVTGYKTAGGRVRVDVTQRLPVIRVISDSGDNYYMDTRGKVMRRMHYSADLVVATGNIDSKYARANLLPIGRYLKYDKFWDSQIAQLRVDSAGNIEMYPRIGNHVVYMGSPAKFTQKLKRLKAFYSQVLNTVGWNKYSRINLEFDNQIICRK